jgi:lipopolysaccharide export system protein LptA
MGKIKLRPRHTLRFISLGVLVVVLVAISFSLLTRSRRQPPVPESSTELKEQKIDKKERIEYREMNKDKIAEEVTADRHYIGDDGMYHLEGNVMISLFGRGNGEDIVLKGEEIIHDRQWSYFWLNGEATVEFKDLIVKSSVLEYNAQKRVFKSDQSVRFTSETISGTARRCDYFLNMNKAELRGEVYLELTPRQEESVPVQVDTDYFEYYTRRGRGKAEGGVLLKHGESRASAGILEFELTASREQIKSMFLRDRVNIILEGEFQSVTPSSDQSALTLHGDTCRLEADDIRIKGFVEVFQVQELEAYGECSFRFISEMGGYTQIEGKKIVFQMTTKGDLKSLVVVGDAKITEKKEEKAFPRHIEGHLVQVKGNKKVLTIEGKDLSKARIWSEDSEITAQKISLYLDNNDIETYADTKVIVYPNKKSQTTVGFFSEDNPVFITSKDMRYSEGRKRFKFVGGTKIWQMKETIKAKEMSFGSETGAFRAQGGVESVLLYQPKDEEREESVWIKSSSMEYDPEKNRIQYREKAELKVKDIDLTARILNILLDEETGDMRDIVASDKVVVIQEDYSGHGDEAKFDVKKEIITVSGNPVLIDKNKGRTEGGKLTFYMADGRIVVENKDRERSVTVIKS